jgi:hypothetical protein
LPHFATLHLFQVFHDALVTGATADVAVARKAYDKQKVIAKSREVDEAALAEPGGDLLYFY